MRVSVWGGLARYTRPHLRLRTPRVGDGWMLRNMECASSDARLLRWGIACYTCPHLRLRTPRVGVGRRTFSTPEKPRVINRLAPRHACLLYTSDAADERSSVDLGGRRIIKKKNIDELY